MEDCSIRKIKLTTQQNTKVHSITKLANLSGREVNFIHIDKETTLVKIQQPWIIEMILIKNGSIVKCKSNITFLNSLNNS